MLPESVKPPALRSTFRSVTGLGGTGATNLNLHLLLKKDFHVNILSKYHYLFHQSELRLWKSINFKPINKQLALRNIKLTCKAFLSLLQTKATGTFYNTKKIELVLNLMTMFQNETQHNIVIALYNILFKIYISKSTALIFP